MRESLPATVLLRLISAYRFLLSPWVGNSCHYWPTCSEYAGEAIEQHGAARGSYRAAGRLARCHPYGRGGVDPVPDGVIMALPLRGRATEPGRRDECRRVHGRLMPFHPFNF